MKRLTKTLRVIAINLALLAVLVEATSVATYFIQTGDFFYRHSNSRKLVGLTSLPGAPNRGSEQPATMQQLHPYFGFIDRVGTGHRFSYSKVNHISSF